VTYHTCPCCGREWRTEDEMRANTEPVGVMHFEGETIELANCPCGTTRVVSVRRDLDDCPETLRATE